MGRPLKIIDLFAGPGGLGEGFSAYRDKNGEHPFRIGLSVEKEASAHKTLQLRAFYRQFPAGEAPSLYYDYLAGKLGKDPDAIYQEPRYRKQAAAAAEEARQFTLGEHNRAINSAIGNVLGKRTGPWVLIGGPPCQAYSLVGRSRNKGIKDYRPEEDHRNFLYREYLKIIAKFQPAVFVMENVKGLLSAKVGVVPIFEEIRKDLECPARALKSNDVRQKYTIFSLTVPSTTNPDPKDFVIKTENFGIPQARHRVILLGVRSNIARGLTPNTLVPHPPPTVQNVIADLPALRSGLSKEEDSLKNWSNAIRRNMERVIKNTRIHQLESVADCMEESVKQVGKKKLGRGSNWSVDQTTNLSDTMGQKLQGWYSDPSGWKGICNHESRGHIASDLHRYLFCACYSQAAKHNGRSTPKAEEFPEVLAPDHANWKSGHFADRFRVQAANCYGTTVTSHISKDGHYFIHYDPVQCRSLTVREAARIQTFPDNYFFVGNRTQQYVQVGNAVPPFLANQIADIVYRTLNPN